MEHLGLVLNRETAIVDVTPARSGERKPSVEMPAHVFGFFVS
jgi:hypothetical protein